MKVTKIKNRVLKESVNQLLEGTGNFYYENVCLLVTDEDYETGNYPAYEDRPINGNNNFPQYPLVDWNDDLCFWQIVMTPGYYEHACIDYVEVDCDDIYNDILYDAEHNIDNYAFEDGKWTYEDAFMRHRGEDPEEHPEEDVIRAVREWVFSDYPIIADEDIKQALERYKKDGYYAPSVFLCDSSIINKIEQQLREKEVEICEQRINEIAKEYGFRKLGTVARFSNGETWYDYIDESLNEDENKDNTDSDFEIEDGILKKYTGNEANVVIPDSVTSIGDWAFKSCRSLTNIVIPNSVTSIGEWAFSGCTSLTSIEIGNSVTSIGGHAFYDCYSLTSVEIPDSVTSIGHNAFNLCKSLTSIKIGNSVKSIGHWAFKDCASLESIEIPDSVTSIDNMAFCNCISLTSIEIPEGVTSINNMVFRNCKSLTSVIIPDSVKSIIDYAFYQCTSLTSITYKGTKKEALTRLKVRNKRWREGSAISKIICTDGVINLKLSESLTEGTDNSHSDFIIEAGILTKYTGNEPNVIIPDGVTSIGKEAFYNCNSLTSIDIPNSVTSIGDYTFDNCTSLENVIFEENSKLTSIGVSAFYNCTSLISIKIPDSVTSIGDWAFRKCKSLTSIAIPNGITSIGEYTFNDCYSLTSVTIGDSVTSIGVGAFESCHSLTSIEIPNSVKYLKDHAFAYCRSLRSITYNGTVYEWDNVVHKYYTWDRGVPAIEITCTDGAIRYEFKSRYSLDGPNKIRLRNTISEGSQEKVYAQALKTGQPLNREELSTLISDKVDEWIADGRITLNTTFNDVEKMFRDEISKSANDIFVVKTFDIVKKRYLDGVKG